MFWVPYASNNRASMFELIKNFFVIKNNFKWLNNRKTRTSYV